MAGRPGGPRGGAVKRETIAFGIVAALQLATLVALACEVHT